MAARKGEPMPLTSATIPLLVQEFFFSFSRSSGPGGQHVNKVNTRVTLKFSVDQSSILTLDEKHRVRHRLASRINKDGILQIVADSRRSQLANKDLAVQRCIDLLRVALQETRRRKRTHIPKRSKERRLGSKKLRSTLKDLRRKV